MNKFFAVFCIVFIFGITACNNKRLPDGTIPTYIPENRNGSTQTETAEITMSVHDILPSGLSFTFENPSNKKYIHGSDYKLYALKNDAWKPLDAIIENAMFTSEAYDIPPQSSVTIKIDWKWLYGELPTGEYKFEKRILFLRSPGDYDDFLAAQNFTLQ